MRPVIMRSSLVSLAGGSVSRLGLAGAGAGAVFGNDGVRHIFALSIFECCSNSEMWCMCPVLYPIKK